MSGPLQGSGSALNVWLRHQAAVEALKQVRNLLNDAGCPLFPVKGVALARWLYADVAERPMADVDLLVSRKHFDTAHALVASSPWPIRYASRELGELVFDVGAAQIELHAEIGRRDLTGFTVDEFLARSTADEATFGFPIRRIDDIDHFLLLVANVVKDYFVACNAHQPEDLRRMVRRIEPRWAELVERAKAGMFVTGLTNTVEWMVEVHEDASFRALLRGLPQRTRRLQPFAVRWHRRSASPGRLLGLTLACSTHDRLPTRMRAVGRLVVRGVGRFLGIGLG